MTLGSLAGSAEERERLNALGEQAFWSSEHIRERHAEGDVKLDKAGPFKTMVFTNIKAGESDSDLSPIDDTYTSIYRIGEDNTWTLLTNFDKDRDQQKPSLDVYRKTKETATSKAK